MTDKHIDASAQRLIAKIARIDEAIHEARAVTEAAPAHGVVRASVAKTLLEAIDFLIPKGTRS